MKLFALIVLLLFGLNGVLVEPLRLLYSERRNIRLLHVDGDRRSQNNLTTTVLAKNLEDAIAVAFHYQDQILFWTDVSLGKILRKAIKKDSKIETVVSLGLVQPEGIAIDWVTKKIYWTDSHLKLIEVVNFDGTQRSVLVWKKLGKPRTIVVDPRHGYMFWSRWGKKSRIVRASMDGTGRKNIITTYLKRPNGLAVDYKDSRLFWLDTHKDYSRLESSNLDGKNRKKLISSSLPRPFSITVYGDRVFWTDRNKLSIESCNKKTGHEKWLVKDKIKHLIDLQAFEAERQPDVPNSCAINNGGCSDLCLLAAGGKHTCACPTGIVLLDDGKTCKDDIDECLSSPCGPAVAGSCKNTLGSYTCVCNKGYKLIGQRCVENKCEEITIPLCQNLSYNITYTPNRFFHADQNEAALEVHQFWPLVQINCSPVLKFFLCSLYAPVCPQVYGKELMPCRKVCKRAKAGCLDLMKHYGFKWPEKMECDLFPEKKDDPLCMAQ